MTEPDRAAETLVRTLVHGRWKAQAVEAVLRLGIPELLRDGDRDLGELAGAAGADPDGLGRLMRLMVALGVFTGADGDRFGHTEDSRRLLPDHPDTQLRDARYTLAPAVRAAWSGLEVAVRRGAPGAGPEPADPATVHAYRAGVAVHNVPGLLAGSTLPDTGTAVMLGAHNAAALVELLRHRPGMAGVVYDGAAALARAEMVLRDAGGSVTALAGDWLESVPAGADAYLLLHLLHDLPDEPAALLLGRVAAAMGGRAQLVALVADRTDTGCHLLPAYLDVAQLLLCGGRERSTAEYAGLFERAGLELVERRDAGPRAGIAVLTARRR